MAKRNIVMALNAVPDGGSPEHGFSLSAFSDFHQKGGQYNVIAVRDTIPKAHYRVGVDGFTRSLLCNTANFCHIKENYYFIHVPLGLISRNAYQMLVDRKQPYSALDMGIEKFPTFSLATVVSRLLDISQLDLTQSVNQKFKDVHGFNIAHGALKLFDMLGYGYFGDILQALDAELITIDEAKNVVAGLVSGKRPTANRLAAYQCTWYHFFRNDIYDNEVSARSFNFDDVTYSSNGTYQYDILTTRQVDDFIIECCQLRYVPYKKDIFTGCMPGTQFGPVSSVSVDVDFTDLTGSFVGNPVTPTGSFTGSSSVINASNDIDYDHHFLTDSARNVIESDVFASNREKPFDRVSLGQSNKLSPVSPIVEGLNVTDYGGEVTGSGAFGAPTGYEGYVHDSHTHNITGSVVPSGSITINSITPTGTINLTGGAVQTSLFDVLQLVEAQAIQKWRQKSMMAGNKTADQFRAHHGIVPKHLIDHLPDFIGSVDNEIQITEITSQADTASDADSSNLGEIRGRGYGASNSRTFDFFSDDYGILLVLHAIVPENTYNSFGIEIGNTMTVYSDFYQNEFQNIGLQSVPKYLLAPNSSDDTPSNPLQEGGNTFNRSVGNLGFVNRFYGYKQYQSKVHGMFNSSRLYKSSGIIDPNTDVFGYADMQSFVMPRRDMMESILIQQDHYPFFLGFALQLTNLYVNPAIFDSIFAVGATSSEDTDNFFSHVNVICEASQPMTVLGLPQF